MNLETEYAELIEILASSVLLASITGRKRPAKYISLVIEAAEMRERCYGDKGRSGDDAVVDDVFSRAAALRKDIAAIFGKSLAVRFSKMMQTRH